MGADVSGVRGRDLPQQVDWEAPERPSRGIQTFPQGLILPPSFSSLSEFFLLITGSPYQCLVAKGL